MKRFTLYLLATLLMVVSADAKGKVKYHSDYSLGLGLSFDDDTSGRVSLHTIQGIKVGKCFSTGIGVGGDLFFEDDTYVFVPVYLNIKGYLPISKRVTPYLSVDIGENFGVTNNIKGVKGLYCTPAVGIYLGRFKVQVGYNIQRLSSDGYKFNSDGLQVRFGFAF